MTTDEIKAKKKELRKLTKAKIAALTEDYKLDADPKIVANLLALPEYANAETVFCFVGDNTEINTNPFLEQVIADGKILSVPLCTGKGIMEARRINALDELKPGYYGLLEPDPEVSPLVEPETIDLAIIPCVSCSHNGERLGHGGGFYDIYFSQHTGMKTVMICRELIMSEEIPAEPHDLVFDKVVTEKGVFTPGGM